MSNRPRRDSKVPKDKYDVLAFCIKLQEMEIKDSITPGSQKISSTEFYFPLHKILVAMQK